MSTRSWRTAVGASVASGSAEDAIALASFRSNRPLLGLALFGEGQSPSTQGEVSIGLKNFGGRLQATLRVGSTGEFAFHELIDPEALWSELESALEFDRLRWQAPPAKRQRGS